VFIHARYLVSIHTDKGAEMNRTAAIAADNAAYARAIARQQKVAETAGTHCPVCGCTSHPKVLASLGKCTRCRAAEVCGR
jgi:DNA repair exonuclease SbcCD ATPase subunit